MTPIPYEPKHMVPVILTAEDGTEYCGEYVDMRIDRKTIGIQTSRRTVSEEYVKKQFEGELPK